MIEIKKGQTKIKIDEGLKTFPNELYEIEESLEYLDLTDNNIDSLPEDFYRFKNLKILFLSNNRFNHVPKVLSKLPKLSMIGIRNNQIKTFEENSLPLTTRWLILTDNEIEKLPNFMGDLKLLQKCMLSGNKIKSLPKSMSKCENLELLRISSNKLNSFPTFLLSLPKLSWLAYSGNLFCKKHPDVSKSKLQNIPWNKLEIKELLGEGASGTIYKAIYQQKEVAIKVFKGEITSDGLPQEEMDINISMGSHKNLIDVLAKVVDHPEQKDVLMLELIGAKYKNLGNPPILESCTRDVYPNHFSISTKDALKILQGMANAAVHMHECFIMHGDFYAHNIMVDEEANTILGDFGGASYYEDENNDIHIALQQLEVRAFGCLVEEMLKVSSNNNKHPEIKAKLISLRDECLIEVPYKRPLFKEISKKLELIF